MHVVSYSVCVAPTTTHTPACSFPLQQQRPITKHRQLEIVDTLLTALTTTAEPLPYPVASHIAQRVVDWATNTLRSGSQTAAHGQTSGSKRKRGSSTSASPWTPTQRCACWAALHTALSSQHAVNASPALWAAVHHALTAALTAAQCKEEEEEGDSMSRAQQLQHVQGVVAQLTDGVLSTAAQPTPEQLGGVVQAAAGLLGAGYSAGVVHALIRAALAYMTTLLQGV